MPAVHLKYSKISLIHMRCEKGGGGVPCSDSHHHALVAMGYQVAGRAARGHRDLRQGFLRLVRKRRDGGLCGAACAAVASAVRLVMVTASSGESGWARGLLKISRLLV